MSNVAVNTSERRIVEHFPNYTVDAEGIVRTKNTNKIIEPIERDGNFYVFLYNRENALGTFVLVARIVARAFVENPDNKISVYFRDGDRSNFLASNLSWDGLNSVQTKYQLKSPDQKLRDLQRRYGKLFQKYIETPISVRELAKDCDVTRSTLSIYFHKLAVATGMVAELEAKTKRASTPKSPRLQELIKHNYSKGLSVTQKTLDGEFVATYPSIRAAGRALGKNRTTTISRALVSPHKTAYGFIWEVETAD